ncbi:unnamed protein product, partial [Mesorhabditis belari]|uniref:G-protein coupled receptors family 1 profile domain-containing protein n=1 Tax=Mesorhabditis belari TaxID=2138241 RepID=A0AAF3FIT0_9BILA
MCAIGEISSPLLPLRFWLIGVSGCIVSLFGLMANGLLATLFLTRTHYRHSPFFFLGFVALFDTLLDATYILLLAVPIEAQYYKNFGLYLMWINYMPFLYLLGQIFKVASVFCLIVASIERYCLTKHWTFTGFESKTRWIVLVAALILAVSLKFITSRVEVQEHIHCTGFERFQIGTIRSSTFMGIINALVLAVPFLTLVFLNGGIVLMLRRQNVQQLRSLITQLTMGNDVMKIRRRNIRAATHTLLVIISAYLLSNFLNLTLTIVEYLDADFLHRDHPIFYQLAADSSSLLTVVGNAIRCPAHFLSNKEIRQQFSLMFFGEPSEKEYTVKDAARRRSSVQESPWISLLLSATQKVHEGDPHQALLSSRHLIKRHSAIAIC